MLVTLLSRLMMRRHRQEARFTREYRRAFIDEPCTWATKEELARMWDAKHGAGFFAENAKNSNAR